MSLRVKGGKLHEPVPELVPEQKKPRTRKHTPVESSVSAPVVSTPEPKKKKLTDDEIVEQIMKVESDDSAPTPTPKKRHHRVKKE